MVRFMPSGLEVEATPGTHLVDVADEHPAAEVPFSCRAATCGTCRVRVEEGLGALAPAGEDEREVLALFGDPADVRLGCQLRLVDDAPCIVLRVVDDS